MLKSSKLNPDRVVLFEVASMCRLRVGLLPCILLAILFAAPDLFAGSGGQSVSTQARSQEPKKPYPYDEQQVIIENEKDGVTLAGTLTTPRSTGPSPAVLLISGSGPQDRDEALMGHKPFMVIADHLTRLGIAVLRVDDRGVGKSTGKFFESTSQDFAEDVLASIRFLRSHSAIDSKRIGLIGHSEGGMIAPMVAARSAEVAFIERSSIFRAR
jgi:dipeptidyl aminopeptidase/acylaminoacyl peptidase